MNILNRSLTIVIPTFNEEESLYEMISEVNLFSSQHQIEIIFVNDGSKDWSLEILNKRKSEYNYTIINNKVNKGYGGAIKEGIKAAQTEYIVTIDADGQHNLSDILILYDNLIKLDADMIIGQRPNDMSPIHRRVAKYFIRQLAGLLMPCNIQDLNSGIKMYNTKLANKYLKLCPDNMAYSDIIALVFISYKHLVVEHPVKIRKRIKGKSTINYKTAFQTIIEILNIVILFNPLNIFLPLSFLFIASGIIWSFQFVIKLKGLSVGSMMLITIGILLFFLGLVSEQLAKIRKSNVSE